MHTLPNDYTVSIYEVRGNADPESDAWGHLRFRNSEGVQVTRPLYKFEDVAECVVDGHLIGWTEVPGYPGYYVSTED